MERGVEWERAAVCERWGELERQRRAARRLESGLVLCLTGLVLALLGSPSKACLEQGPWPHGCTAVVPTATSAVLLIGGFGAIAVGLVRCRRALRA